MLSPTGRRQARQRGERRRDNGVGHVWVSDLAGAVETATIAFAGLAGLADPADRRREPGGCRKTVSRWLSAAEAERHRVGSPTWQTRAVWWSSS